MYLGDCPVGAIILHAWWGIGYVRRREEACVVCRLVAVSWHTTSRQPPRVARRNYRLAYNDRVSVCEQLAMGS